MLYQIGVLLDCIKLHISSFLGGLLPPEEGGAGVRRGGRGGSLLYYSTLHYAILYYTVLYWSPTRRTRRHQYNVLLLVTSNYFHGVIIFMEYLK